MFPKVTDVFLAGKWVRFTLPLHPHSPAITRLMSSDYLDMIWKEIEGKNHSTPACPWPRCLPSHIPPASRLALAITGMFLLRRPLTSAWISSEICPGKGAGTVHLTSVPIIQISLENPLGKCFPPSNESVHKGSNWIWHTEIKAWIIEYQSPPWAPSAPRPALHLIPGSAFLLTPSTWTPKPPSWTGFPFIIKIRMQLLHKEPSVTLTQWLFTEHLLCPRHSACLWRYKNQWDPVPADNLESKRQIPKKKL